MNGTPHTITESRHHGIMGINEHLTSLTTKQPSSNPAVFNMSRIDNTHFNNNGSRAEGVQEKADSNTLVIVQQPPAFVFSEEWFNVGLDLTSVGDISASFIELRANLHRYVNDDILSQPAQDNQIVDLHLLVNEQNEKTDANGVKHTIANCKIKSPLPRDDNPILYCLKFFYRSRQAGAVIEDIEQACSIPGKLLLYVDSLIIFHLNLYPYLIA